MKKLLVVFIGMMLLQSVCIGQNNDYLSYFNETYDESRTEFVMFSDMLSQRYADVQYIDIPVPSKIDQNLHVDVCYIPASKKAVRLLILSSGTHGIEGFVGNAVQELFIKEYLNKTFLEETGVLMIHGLNPYGFKYERRVTENNVDLNRNSGSTADLYKTENTGYSELYDFLNPAKSVNYASAGNKLFTVKAIKKIVQASLPVLRQAVLQGQYQFPDGLYFGGTQQEPQIAKIGPVIKTIAEPYKLVMNIDLHTGYGETGKLHFFPNPIEDQGLRTMTEGVFEGYQIDWGDSDDFYTITGDFSGFITDQLEGKTHIPMTFEYGTMDSQKTMGSIKSIHNMILENQGVHHGYKDEKDKMKVEQNLREMYYPSDPAWRIKIMKQTQEVFKKVLPRFVALD